MTFFDMAADDLESLVGDSGDLGIAAAFQPDGFATSMPLTIIPADSPDVLEMMGAGLADNRTMLTTASLAAVRAIILALTGVARDPQAGDHIIITAPVVPAGDWTITAPQPDQGGGVVLALRSERIHAAGFRKGGG